jgi:hypothetical protein
MHFAADEDIQICAVEFTAIRPGIKVTSMKGYQTPNIHP